MGVVGELLLGGPGLALGLSGRAARLTAVRVRPRPARGRAGRGRAGTAGGDFVRRRRPSGRAGVRRAARRAGEAARLPASSWTRSRASCARCPSGRRRGRVCFAPRAAVERGAPGRLRQAGGRAEPGALLELSVRSAGCRAPCDPDLTYVPPRGPPPASASTGKLDRAALLAANHAPQVLVAAAPAAGAAGEGAAKTRSRTATIRSPTRCVRSGRGRWATRSGLDDNFFHRRRALAVG